MKIGFFTDTYFPQVNGVTFTISEWKNALKKHKDVELYIYYPESSYVPEENEIPLKSVSFKFYEDYKVAVPMSRQIKNASELDVVHIHGLFSSAILGTKIAKKFSIPCVLTYHTPADRYLRYITKSEKIQKKLKRAYNIWERKILDRCDLITTPSSPMKKELAAKGFDNAIALSNGIDLNVFKPASDNEIAEFQKNFLDKDISDKKVAGYCGRIGYEKKLEDIIEIANDFAEEFNGVIMVAGGGPALEYYKGMVKDKGVKNVIFLGYMKRETLRAFYSLLDVFLFPSVVETQGVVALEAMACGVPVIGANALAMPETVTDTVTGYLYEPGNTKELMEKIRDCYKNRARLSDNCLAHIKEHSVDRIIEQLLEIYGSLI